MDALLQPLPVGVVRGIFRSTSIVEVLEGGEFEKARRIPRLESSPVRLAHPDRLARVRRVADIGALDEPRRASRMSRARGAGDDRNGWRDGEGSCRRTLGSASTTGEESQDAHPPPPRP